MPHALAFGSGSVARIRRELHGLTVNKVDSYSSSTQLIAVAFMKDAVADGAGGGRVNPSVRLTGQMELEVGADEGERGLGGWMDGRKEGRGRERERRLMMLVYHLSSPLSVEKDA